MTDPNYVRIITGVRRCGKSTLLELYRRHLINTGTSDDAIFVINFEDHSDAPLRDLTHSTTTSATRSMPVCATSTSTRSKNSTAGRA
ncbi:AAA family ATPase [Corynebacterium cystitidis]|uniref:AAA family ATPase n=1 Tax=Corynebacterium cystitidis TaxID=35757 RepID=UPI00211E871A|nr:AAA family ATPase [Corynebacterium cystitidis]